MPPANRWPFPGELPLVRARRVAHAYRALAIDAGADPTTLDQRFRDWGETWAAPAIVTCGPDDWLTAREAGELSATSAANINGLRRQGRISGRKNERNVWVYRARDITALSAAARTRKPRARVTLTG